MPQAERIAVLVIRVWREESPSSKVRARVMQTVDVTKPGREELTVSGESAIVAAVRLWLDSFAAG